MGLKRAAQHPKKAAAKGPVAVSAPGLSARRLAARIVGAVLLRKASLDEALDGLTSLPDWQTLDGRDRAFARLLATTHLRRRGQITDVLSRFMRKPIPSEAGEAALALELAAAQLLFLQTPAHAAIDLAVRQCQAARHGARYGGLANAVLRKVAADGPAIIAAQDAARLATPDWLLARWTAAYGADTAREIALAHLTEPALDLSFASVSLAEGLAAELGAEMLATGGLRIGKAGRIEELAGYGEGKWWVQDAAASLPARLLGDVRGREVADLCAAPGGKTAQLAAAGAKVTAVDASAKRIARLVENLRRLALQANVVEADVRNWSPGHRFAAVLLDAPCSATGTIRRHPDIPHLRTPGELASLTGLQDQLLDAAVGLLAPGGVLVYCVCSLEPEEGPERIAHLLGRHPHLSPRPVAPAEVGGLTHLISADGWLRTLPCHFAGSSSLAKGMDGFFAARLVLT